MTQNRFLNLLHLAQHRAADRHRLFFFTLAVALLFLLRGAAPGQAQTPAPTPRPLGEISGTVMADDGQPLPNAQVFLSNARGDALLGSPRNLPAEPNGRFRFSGLRLGVYYLQASAPGYVMPDDPERGGHPAPYRVGANVNLTLSKGGVITGTVTDSAGQPVVGARVTAMRARDSFGRRPLPQLRTPETVTDDRGIYRIYGLTPGSYLVAAGAVTSGSIFETIKDSLNGAMVYYPSSSAESATRIDVALGQEVGGIDIRTRGDAGHEISGFVVGATRGPEGQESRLVAILQKPNGGPQVAATLLLEQNGQVAFSFGQVPDGEYDLIAETWKRNDGAGSLPKRVTLKGADLSGIQLSVTRFATVSGRLALETDPALRDKPECAVTGRPPSFEDFAFELRPVKPVEAFGYDAWANLSGAIPDERGGFQRSGLRAGTYWPQIDFPDDRQYLRSVTRPGPGGKPVNALANGLVLGGGEKITGLVVTLSDGAAGLKGRLALPEGTPAAAGTPPALPAHVLVHLVPAEPTAADDVLRYREIEPSADGSFALANLAPGKYWVYAEQLPATAATTGDTRDTVRALVAWNPAARLKLRRVAEAANVALELKPCQRLNDYALKFSSTSVK